LEGTVLCFAVHAQHAVTLFQAPTSDFQRTGELVAAVAAAAVAAVMVGFLERDRFSFGIQFPVGLLRKDDIVTNILFECDLRQPRVTRFAHHHAVICQQPNQNFLILNKKKEN
jgi:hypothetical protein